MSEDHFLGMQSIYKNFTVSPDGKTGDLVLSEQWTLKANHDVEPEEWRIHDAASGEFFRLRSKGVPGEIRMAAGEFICTYKDLAPEEAPKDPVENLKAGGFEFNQEAENPEAPEEEQQKKILERTAEEKARLEREENIRRLEELERLEQAESELEAKKALDEAKKAKEPSESSGNGHSKTPLLDMIHSYVGNDVLEIFGETGSGKSKFALTVAKEAVAAGKKVFYLDTERNLTESDIRDLKGCEYKYTPIIDEIDSIVQNLPNVDVVILDSIGFPVLTTFARMSVKQKGDALLKLIAIFGDLKAWAYKNNGVVVVTNQPESEFNKGPNHILRPFGDKSQFAAKEIWETKFMDRKPACTKSRISAFRSRSVGHGTRIADMEISSGGVGVI